MSPNRGTAFKAALVVFTGAMQCPAQTNVRAWHAAGQTWVVWQTSPPDPVTYDIYSSPAPITSVVGLTPVGRLFREEWGGARLRTVNQNARWVLPTPGGGTYQLTATEGAFAHTPHAPAANYFIVVKHGETAVGPANITSALIFEAYDPVNDPVRAHPQLSVSREGYTGRACALWIDGRAEHGDRRPDIPVLGNAARHGTPHIFVVWEPPGGLSAGPYPAAFSLHGASGAFMGFRPGNPDVACMSLDFDDGLIICPDDSIYFRWQGATVRQNARWLGYWQDFDPFSEAARTNPPPGSLLVDYSVRRTLWTLDYLLGPHSPYRIDRGRVSIIGHSRGGTGAGIIGRSHPERFNAVVMYSAGLGINVPNPIIEIDPLFGVWSQNLPTVIAPGGVTLGFTDVFRPYNRLSHAQRDFAMTRLYSGRNDRTGFSTWSRLLTDEIHRLDDSGIGAHLFWDEREHPPEQWPLDDPLTPVNDAGQWVSPRKTERPSVRSLARYRADQSYPGVFNVDLDAATPGQLPVVGDGDPRQGDAWGTWGGYLDWDPATMTDAPTEWACTMWLVGLSAVAIDNCPAPAAVADLSPRKTQRFNPLPGTALLWRVTDSRSGATLQCGLVDAGPEGLVTLRGLSIPRDPDRVRVTIAAHDCYADCEPTPCPGTLDIFDFLCFQNRFAAAEPYACDCDLTTGPRVCDVFDFLCFQNAFAAGCR